MTENKKEIRYFDNKHEKIPTKLPSIFKVMLMSKAFERLSK